MASVFRKPKSPYFYGAYRDAKGIRRHRSTKCAVRNKALAIVVGWERAAAAGRAGTLTDAACRRIIAELHEQTTGEPMLFFTCSDWLDEWAKGKVGVVAESTLVKYRQVFSDFKKSLGEKAKLALGAIIPKDIRRFRDALRKEGRSQTTVNASVHKVLSAPFASAVRLGYISVNPCAGVDSLKDEDPVEREVFKPQEVRCLVDTAKGDWKGFILGGYYTGLRMGDLSNLLWEKVNMGDRVIELKTKKTRAKVKVPIHDQFYDWLRKQTRGVGKAPVFPALCGRTGSGKNGLSSQFGRLMKAAGISRRAMRAATGAGRSQSSLTFHSLRHSFNSALANAGISQELRQQLVGHSDAATNARYTHHEIEPLRKAVDTIPHLSA